MLTWFFTLNFDIIIPSNKEYKKGEDLMASYVKERYKNTRLTPIVSRIVNDMHDNPKSWNAPHKTGFQKHMHGMNISILRNFFEPDKTVTLFVDMVEQENLTDKDVRILAAEFGYLRQKFEAYIAKQKDEQPKRKKFVRA